MTRFRFQLQPLLDVREREEHAAQRTVAELETMRRRMEEQIRRRQHDLAEGKQVLRGALVGSLDFAALRLHAASAVQVMRSGHRQVLELAGVMKRLEQARILLTECARRRRAIELLRDRRLEEWRREQDRAELPVLDELAVSASHLRRSRSPEGHD